MTKKAENMVNKLKERVEPHLVFYKDNDDVVFGFTPKYVNEIFVDFHKMISNMWLFELISEKDYHELFYTMIEYRADITSELDKIELNKRVA